MHSHELIRVADNPHLRRDPANNAIIDVDADAYERYQLQRAERLATRQQISQLEERINNHENLLVDIKTILQQLLDK
jgi:hypothetical protein